MRRRDVLSLIVLSLLIIYSWYKLKLPISDAADYPADQIAIAGLGKWSGAIDKAFASDPAVTQGQPTVKGAATDTLLSPTQKPQTLLPVEEYHGSPSQVTLPDMLRALGVTVYPEDVIEAFPSPNLGLGSVIKIYRATPVVVTDWGKEKVYRTWTKTGEDFLAEAGIELGDNDRIEPGIKTTITPVPDQPVLDLPAAHYMITRVEITEVKVPESIDFKKIQKEDATLPRGQKKVTPGKVGKRVKTYKVRRENGVEVNRDLIKNEVTDQPQDEITIIGTKVLIGKTFSGRASWYKYDSTKVASDLFKRGTNLRITNLDSGKVIFVTNDGCICADTGFVVDLHPDYFTALGGKVNDGVMKRVKVDEVLN